MRQLLAGIAAKHALAGLFFLSFVTLGAQEQRGPVAKYTFNEGRDFDEVSKKKAKLVGVKFAEDRFGNEGSAVYVFGNEFSYVNLGPDPVLKPRVGSISLWVNIELAVFAGKG